MTTSSPATEPTQRLPALGRALLLVHLALSPLLFSRHTVEAFEFNKAALLQLTALLLCVGGLVHLLRQPCRPCLALLRDPLCLGFALFWLSAVASTCASVNPLLSLRGGQTSHLGLLTVTAYTVLFFATRALCQAREDIERLLRGCLLATAVTVTYGLVQWAGADPIRWLNVSQIGAYCRPFSTLGHANILAAWVTLSLPIALWWAVQSWRDGRRLSAIVGATLAVMSLAVVGLTLSRAGWLAVVVTVAVLLLGWKARTGMRVGAVGLSAAVLVAVAGWLALSPGSLSADTLGQRVGQVREIGPRRHIWEAAWRLTLQRPVLGWGLDTFSLAFPRERTPDYWHQEWNTVPERAHNMAFQVLATQGVVGGLAGLILLTGIVWAGWRAWQRPEQGTQPLALLCLAGLAGFLAQGMFGFTTAACGALAVTYAALLSRLAAGTSAVPGRSEQRPALAIITLATLAVLGDALVPSLVETDRVAPMVGLFVLLLVSGCVLLLLWRQEPPPEPCEEASDTEPPSVWSLVALSLWGLAGLAVWFWFVPQYRAELACAEGLRSWQNGPILALGHLEEATEADPGNPFYWSQLGRAAEQAGLGSHSPEHRQRLLLQSLEAHRRADALVPDHAEGMAAQARLLKVLGRHQEAAHHLDRALALDPSNPYLRAEAAEAALAQGHVPLAREHLDRGLGGFPDFQPLRALEQRLPPESGH